MSAPLSDFMGFFRNTLCLGWDRRRTYKKIHEINIFQSINRSYPQTHNYKKKKLYYPELLSVNLSLPELLFNPCILGDNHTVKAQQNWLMPVS